jgi:hypothetical protein
LKKVCEISASQANLGDLVKVFQDYLYFLMEDKKQISVLSYSHDQKTKNVSTKEEVHIKIDFKVRKKFTQCNFSSLLLVDKNESIFLLNLFKPLQKVNFGFKT